MSNLNYQIDRDFVLNAQKLIENGRYETCVHMMDDDLREFLHAKLYPCNELVFLAAYLELHEEKFDQPFAI